MLFRGQHTPLPTSNPPAFAPGAHPRFEPGGVGTLLLLAGHDGFGQNAGCVRRPGSLQLTSTRFNSLQLASTRFNSLQLRHFIRLLSSLVTNYIRRRRRDASLPPLRSIRSVHTFYGSKRRWREEARNSEKRLETARRGSKQMTSEGGLLTVGWDGVSA